MFENFNNLMPFVKMDTIDGFEEENAEEFEMGFSQNACEEAFGDVDLCGEDLCDEELSEEEILAQEAELLISQQQGNWLDGYLDAMDEWEED